MQQQCSVGLNAIDGVGFVVGDYLDAGGFEEVGGLMAYRVND